MWDAHANGFGSNDGTDFSWGLGMGWNFTDHFTVNGEYQSFDIEDTDGADFWSLSGVWRF